MTARGELSPAHGEPSPALWRRWVARLRGSSAAVSFTAARWVTLAALLPTPLWFLLNVLLDPGPAWRALYHEQVDFTGAQALTTERRLGRYWDRDHRSVPGDFNFRQFSAVFDTCLELREPRAIPFQLVVNGSARLLIDGQERLRAGRAKARDARGDVLELGAGVHHLRVEFVAEGWSSIALNASLDGRAPVAVPPEQGVPGVTWFHPRRDGQPCAR